MQEVPAAGLNLSERELDVLLLLATGYTNDGVAERCFNSKRTVEGHQQPAINKMRIRDSPALVAFAVQHGLLSWDKSRSKFALDG